jgi:hypothetical protein
MRFYKGTNIGASQLATLAQKQKGKKKKSEERTP